MLIIISPSKTIEQSALPKDIEPTNPLFINKAQEIVERMRQLNVDDIKKVMKVSPKLAQLTYERFISWNSQSHTATHPALNTFRGAVFEGIAAQSFSSSDLNFAQKHLRILSGLYGVLRPLDLIQPYRLEMGTSIDINEFDNLYHFWREMLTTSFQQEVEKNSVRELINLASLEYSKSVNLKQLNVNVITPSFMEHKGDQLKTVTIYAKRARGLMVRYAIKNRITHAETLKGFNEEGYIYSEALSTKTKWVFIR